MNEVRIALRNVGRIDPMSIEDYIQAGGYEALKKARTMDRGGLIETIEETSRLRGRGGAAFPTGKKWSSASSRPPSRMASVMICSYAAIGVRLRFFVDITGVLSIV